MPSATDLPVRWILVCDVPTDALSGERDDVAAVFPLTDDPRILGALAEEHGDRLVPAGERVQRAMVALRDDLVQWCGAIARAAGPGGRTLFDRLGTGPGSVNGWWFTLLGERNPGKTDAFLKLAQCAAVQTLSEELKSTGLWVSLRDPRLADALAALARRRGLAVRGGRAARRSPARSRLRAVARAVKWGARVLMKFVAARWVLGPPPRTGAVDATVVTYFPHVDGPAADRGIFQNTYAPELQKLFEDRGQTLGWLLIAVPHAGQSFGDALRLVRRFRRVGVRLALWEEFATPGSLARAFGEWWRAARAATAVEVRAAADRATANGPMPEAAAYLAEIYDQSVWGVDGLSGRVYDRAFRDFFSTRATGNVFYFAEMHGWERALAAARGAPGDGKLFAYQHAAVGTNELNYYTAPWENTLPAPGPDVWVANGAVTEAIFRRGGHPRVVRAEALRHLSLGPKMRRPVNARREAFALALSGIDWRESRSLLAWVLWGVAKGFPLRWRVRLHPSADRDRVLRGWPAGALARLEWEASPSSAHDALERAAVAVTGSTSMALDALALGCRVVVPLFSGGLSLNPLLEETSIRDAVDTPAALHRTAAERANAPFDPTAAARGRAFVEKYWELDERLPRWKSLLFGGTPHG
ncbi:MAG: hypothetical protein IPP68_00090 [Elusimicrobia bacterium]|nr:hypothetical protein [Elusimicrobiota bacterium]